VLDKLEIPAGPVNTLEQVMDDPHLDAVGFFRHMRHPSEGEIVVPDVPIRFAETPAAIDRLQPRLGEHGREILRELGMSTGEIEALAASGGVVMPVAAEPVK
jgi:crotonobetainyl-CoA:carnitine CoA-transferase CaiB-like acyl-CoA transferase